MGSMRRLRRPVAPAAGLAAALVALAAAGCGDSGSPTRRATTPAPERLHIYSDLPMRPPQQPETQAMVDAVRQVIEDRQDAAGDYAVKFIERDDSDATTGLSDAAICAANARQIAGDALAVGVIGTYDTACTRAELPILNRAGIVLIAPVNQYPGFTEPTAPGEPDRYDPSGHPSFARIAPRSSLVPDAAVALAQALDVKQLAVVYANRPSQEALAQSVEGAAGAADISVAIHARDVPTSSDALIQRDRGLWRTIAAEKADAVLFLGTLDDAPADFWRTRAAVLGDSAGDVRLIAPPALYDQRFLDDAGIAADGTRVLYGFLPPESLSGKGADFVSEYTRRYGQPLTYTAYAAEAASVLLEAIARSDGTAPSVRDEVLRTRFFDGILGRWSFDANGDITPAHYASIRIDGGRFRFDRALELG
jgi:branched-chain amino acid transport system substrate-binding protein